MSADRQADRIPGARDREADPAAATLNDLRDALIRALYLEKFLRWLDRQLRRWPWFYRKLGGES